MRLAKEIKLDVAETRYDSELCAAVITRYDREVHSQGSLKRLHQNDLCQILGIPSSKKYEAEGCSSLVDCFAAIFKHSSQPAKDKKRLIEWVIFNVLVGHRESHAKNLSLMTVDNKNKLTPFYDLVCTAVYPNLSKKFAFKMGGENRPDWIMPRHWERFSNDIDTRPAFVIKIIMDMMSRIEHALPVVIMEIEALILIADERIMIKKIEVLIKKSISKLKSRLVESH